MKNAMYEALIAFGLTAEECADFFNTAGEWNYTKTHSKQIIGINNQQYFDATWGQEYILDGQTAQPIWSKWVGTVIKNFPMVLIWNLFFAGPLTRLLFKSIYQK